jgi:hypothetical protein
MANRFANGRKSFGFCDLCSFRYDLKQLKNLVVKTKQTQIKACPQCWTPDQPQLQLGMYPISDPQAIRDPRPDTNTWYQSGTNGLQTSPTSGLLPANPFTADGTTTVLVNAPNHGALTGTYVTFSGATVFSGVVIVGQYQLTVVNANSYAITYATPVPAGNGGGSAVTFAYQPAAGVLQQGYPGEGMLVIQWGWNPIGGARDFDAVLTPNTLVGVGEVGQVTIGNTGTPQFTLVEVLYTTPGTYSWTAPTSTTQIYVLCVGGGGSSGHSVLGVGTDGVDGGDSAFGVALTAGGGKGGKPPDPFTGFGDGGAGGAGTALSATVFGGDGGAGGTGTPFAGGGGGGAGGYAGVGGAGGIDSVTRIPGQAGTGGAGGGGYGWFDFEMGAAGGGGVGLSGLGANGAGGFRSPTDITAYSPSGGGGSGGANGTAVNGFPAYGATGGLYGGGGGGSVRFNSGAGGGGALRWTFVTTTLGATYTVVVGAGGVVVTGGSGANGAVKIAYWQPIP